MTVVTPKCWSAPGFVWPSAVHVQVDSGLSERIFEAFKAGHLLDSNDRLQHDPRYVSATGSTPGKCCSSRNQLVSWLHRATSQDWQALLTKNVPDVTSVGLLEADRSFIHEELNVLWAGVCSACGVFD